MNRNVQSDAVALGLMRSALDHLNRAGECHAAPHLALAIEMLSQTIPPENRLDSQLAALVDAIRFPPEVPALH